MKKNPLNIVRDRFETKEALVDDLIGTGLLQLAED